MVVRVVRHAAEIAGMREAVALAATLGGTVGRADAPVA